VFPEGVSISQDFRQKRKASSKNLNGNDRNSVSDLKKWSLLRISTFCVTLLVNINLKIDEKITRNKLKNIIFLKIERNLSSSIQKNNQVFQRETAQYQAKNLAKSFKPYFSFCCHGYNFQPICMKFYYTPQPI